MSCLANILQTGTIPHNMTPFKFMWTISVSSPDYCEKLPRRNPISRVCFIRNGTLLIWTTGPISFQTCRICHIFPFRISIISRFFCFVFYLQRVLAHCRSIKYMENDILSVLDMFLYHSSCQNKYK